MLTKNLATSLVNTCQAAVIEARDAEAVEAEAVLFLWKRKRENSKNRGRKEIGSAILWRRAHRGNISIKK